ncbi:MAG: signal peptide peptidase SppA [Gemmatimonadales bacterium]|nr:signal peptide peptidase SppA [Gemmatimonadales bacterium]
MRKFWIVFLIIATVIIGGMGLMWRAVSNFEESVSIAGGVLVWEVAGNYPEELDTSFLGQLQGAGAMTLQDVIFALYRAAEDDRITGLVLDMRSLEVDWAKIEEIREAVLAFQGQDKPVIAYLDGAGTREYALAVAADRIIMSPEANIMVLGVTAELDFLKEVLGKLGMEADFIHVGKYKSAPERMTRTSPTEANREMIVSIVEDRFEILLDMLATGRDTDLETVSHWIDIGMFDTETALAEGLADTSLYYEEMLDLHFPEDEVTFLADYVLDPGSSPRSEHEVGVVFITGVIMPGESRFDRWQGKIAGSETVVDDLRRMGEDSDIGAVILRVDSPGGSALASDLIWREIREVRKEKPIIVSMSGMAASGGYYVSCLADSIFADPGTLTGSIGVYAGKMSRTAMYEKIGVQREFITRGRNALLFSDEGTFTPGQRELFTGQMERFYQRFLGKVAQGRDLEMDAVHAVAQGRVWTGRQGLHHNLVDELGGFRRSLDSAKFMMGLDLSQKVRVVSFGEELSMLEKILLRSFRQGGGLGTLAVHLAGGEAWGPWPWLGAVGPLPELQNTLREDGTLAAVALLDGRPVAMAPFWLRVR